MQARPLFEIKTLAYGAFLFVTLCNLQAMIEQEVAMYRFYIAVYNDWIVVMKILYTVSNLRQL